MDENDLYETYISYDQEQKYLIFRLHKRQDINIINEQSLSLKQWKMNKEKMAYYIRNFLHMNLYDQEELFIPSFLYLVYYYMYFLYLMYFYLDRIYNLSQKLCLQNTTHQNTTTE